MFPAVRSGARRRVCFLSFSWLKKSLVYNGKVFFVFFLLLLGSFLSCVCLCMCALVSFDRLWMGPYHLIQYEIYVFSFSFPFSLSFRTYVPFLYKPLCTWGVGGGHKSKVYSPTETEFTADLGTVPPPLTLYTSTVPITPSSHHCCCRHHWPLAWLRVFEIDYFFFLLFFSLNCFFTFCVRPGRAPRDS
ncbi:hypothetical protein P167DRAFT_300785 [Morchella conica CCBAS932]|uniref:Uncharacterized protein n=1 Tax=Morchella conica CCBAS932 TaxID=1392247 RepID=A0A3N4KGE6_9PEZI|nr:hypothetical protein P167DRAFT_300785 [Morchella conica CCBAS932]